MVQQYTADRLTNFWRQVRQMIFNPVRHGGIKVFGERSLDHIGIQRTLGIIPGKYFRSKIWEGQHHCLNSGNGQRVIGRI